MLQQARHIPLDLFQLIQLEIRVDDGEEIARLGLFVNKHALAIPLELLFNLEQALALQQWHVQQERAIDAQQIDAQQRLEESWGAVRDYLTDVFDWSGLKGIEAEELTVFPGMDELFSLASRG